MNFERKIDEVVDTLQILKSIVIKLRGDLIESRQETSEYRSQCEKLTKELNKVQTPDITKVGISELMAEMTRRIEGGDLHD